MMNNQSGIPENQPSVPPIAAGADNQNITPAQEPQPIQAPPVYPQECQPGTPIQGSLTYMPVGAPVYAQPMTSPGGTGGGFVKVQPAVKPVEKRIYTTAQKWLIPAGLALGIAFDRLLFSNLGNMHYPFWVAIFAFLYLAVFYCFNWTKLKKNGLMWMVTGIVVALCSWNFIFDYRSSYGAVSVLVIPGILMAQAMFVSGGFTLKEVLGLSLAWLHGWFVKPLSAIPHFFGAAGSAYGKGNKTAAKRVLLGVSLSLPLLLIVLPLLAGADGVFRFYLNKIIGDFYLPRFVFHTGVAFVGTLLFFSFLWNVSNPKIRIKKDRKEASFDAVVSGVALGILLLVYGLFCAIQFTYLFAGAGLPGEMTYSEYAREGFWQLIVVAGINLVIFGLALSFTKRHKAITALLAGLLGATALMLVSGFARLGLYIDAFGLTWLRLLSFWFMLYLAVVLVLCGLRLIREKMPLIAICAFILMAWYGALGYANPDALVVRYNLASHEPAQWVEENASMLYYLSDDGMLALIESGVQSENLTSFIQRRQSFTDSGKSLSSWRARQMALPFREE